MPRQRWRSEKTIQRRAVNRLRARTDTGVFPERTCIRRRDLCLAGLLFNAFPPLARGQNSPPPDKGFRPLFDGVSLRGWTPKTRTTAQPSVGRWVVENGVIIGGQDPPGVGSYLVSDEAFEEFELVIEARPDWPADTGILVRTVPEGNVGIQVLCDHRPHGGIAGYYGNNLGGFHAYEYAFNSERDENGRVVRLIPEAPSEPTARIPLDFAAPVDVFLKTWKPDGWNQFRIRCVGQLPHLTTWINGIKVSELYTANIKLPNFDPKSILAKIGRSGHIALEVHNNDARMGKDRWGLGNVCRWRNISIRTL